MMRRFQNILWASKKASKSSKGQTLVEYALILGLVSIIAMVMITVLGEQIMDVFSVISNTLDTLSD